MLFQEADAPHLKAWLTKRLADEPDNDADPDVLAEYMMAVLSNDGDLEAIRKVFLAETADFLKGDSSFVSDLFAHLQYKSYLPGAPPPPKIPPKLSAQASQPAQSAKAPARLPAQNTYVPSDQPPFQGYYTPQFPQFYESQPIPPTFGPRGSRKRGYRDLDAPQPQGPYDDYSGRHFKQPRRRGGFAGQNNGLLSTYGQAGPQGFQPFPPPGAYNGSPGPFAPGTQGGPPELQNIDRSAIIDNIQRLQAMLQVHTQELPKPVYSGSLASSPSKKKRCRDFDRTGVCPRGINCRFDHGTDLGYMPPLVDQLMTGDYDPANATLPLSADSQKNQASATIVNIGNDSEKQKKSGLKGRESKKPRRKGREPFSAEGPVNDRSKTQIVVENIPEENFTEDSIREFFSQFGTVDEVKLQPYKRVAILKFDSWDAANTAYKSPKVMFDNRFVKVFWFKDPEKDDKGPKKDGKTNRGTNGNLPASEVPEFDMEAFLAKQQEAQKIHEEKTQRRQEVEKQRQELDERQKELLARQREERRRLEERIVANGGKREDSPVEISTGSNTPVKGNARPTGQTESLRAQLAALEAEANSLGLDPDAASEVGSPWAAPGRGRGRGFFSGRGTYTPRATRGGYGYRGRGGVEARHAAYAAFSIDNRPRVVKVSGVDFTMPSKDETLRQYLFGVGEFTDIQTTPDFTSITFKDRQTAEKFMFGLSATSEIPGVDGKVELSWGINPPLPKIQTDTQPRAVESVVASGFEDEHAEIKSKETDRSATLSHEPEDRDKDREQVDMDYEDAEDEWN